MYFRPAAASGSRILYMSRPRMPDASLSRFSPSKLSRLMAAASVSAARAAGTLDDAGCAHAIAACAEGYAFPTNLDRDPPLGGLAPESPLAVACTALREAWPPAALDEHLATLAERRLS